MTGGPAWPLSMPAVGSGGDYSVDLPPAVPFAVGVMHDVFVEVTQGATKWNYRQRVKGTDTP